MSWNSVVPWNAAQDPERPFSICWSCIVSLWITDYLGGCLLTMLTFKIVVKTLFIMDFDRMAMIEETNMLKWMAAFTTSVTGLHVLMEAFLRNHRGLEHYPRWCLSVYISKVGLIYN